MRDLIRKVIEIETLRYRQLGYWAIVHIGLWYLSLAYLPTFLYSYWKLFHIDQNPLTIGIAIVCLRNGIVITMLSFYNFLYYAKIPFFEQFRIKQDPWPWESDSNFSIIKAYKTNIINDIMLNIFIIFAKCKFELTDRIPGSLEIVKTFLFCISAFSFFFYIAHRIMHIPFLYSRFHKVHHEYKVTIATANTYSHPIDFIFGEAIPLTLAYILYGRSNIHIVTFLMCNSYLNATVINIHSGYSFPWEMCKIIPFTCPGEFHDYHHATYEWNYGEFLYIMDLVMGTSSDLWKPKKNARNLVKIS